MPISLSKPWCGRVDPTILIFSSNGNEDFWSLDEDSRSLAIISLKSGISSSNPVLIVAGDYVS